MGRNSWPSDSSRGVQSEASRCGTSNRAKPEQNAFIERFNRSYRTEVLNAYVFESLEQVQELSAQWLRSYNEERPHDALAGLPPAMYRAQLETRNSPVVVSR